MALVSCHGIWSRLARKHSWLKELGTSNGILWSIFNVQEVPDTRAPGKYHTTSPMLIVEMVWKEVLVSILLTNVYSLDIRHSTRCC